MLISILKGAPIWVWPLLVFLIYFGLKATRQRATYSLLIYLLPLLGLLSANAVNTLPIASAIWIVFVLAYLFGAWRGFRFQENIVLGKEGPKVELAGEWVTLAALMIVFWMNFFGGVTKVISPTIYASQIFHIIFAAVAALAAGSFLGRAFRVFKQ